MDNDTNTKAAPAVPASSVKKTVAWIAVIIAAIFLAYFVSLMMSPSLDITVPPSVVKQPTVSNNMSPEEAARMKEEMSKQPASMTPAQQKQLEATIKKQPTSMTPEQREQLEAAMSGGGN
jgi:hypothetical protein